jgi:hypothetical protein
MGGTTTTTSGVTTSQGGVIVPQDTDAQGNVTGEQDLTGNQEAPKVSHMGEADASLGDVATGAGAGALGGAAIGSVVPVIGTGVGAIVGGVVGAVAGYFGGGDTRDAVQKSMENCDAESLQPKIKAWRTAETLLNTLHDDLTDIKPALDDAWKDEIGKKASQRVTDIAGSAHNLAGAAKKNGDALEALYNTIKPVRESFGHRDSTMSDVGNFVTGGRDEDALNAYNGMIDKIQNEVLPKYPASVNVTLNGHTSELNLGDSTPTLTGATPHAGGGPGGVGGAPHVANANVPKIADQHELNQPHPTIGNHDPNGPHDINTPHDAGSHIAANDPPNAGDSSGSDGDGSGVGSGASLAGLDGGGAGGLGGVGGLDPAGLGAGGLNGAGAGSAGGAGAGSAGLGAGGAGTARGAIGPMMGGHGGAGGEEEERERST